MLISLVNEVIGAKAQDGLIDNQETFWKQLLEQLYTEAVNQNNRLVLRLLLTEAHNPKGNDRRPLVYKK